jgi:hypothetical protein
VAKTKSLISDQRARATRDAGVVRSYTELARQWRELAEQIERNKT